MNWIQDMFSSKGQKKEASETTNQEKEFERKIEAQDWVKDVMNIDETELEKEADDQFKAEEAARGIKEPFDEVGAIMAYEQGELSDQDSLKLFSELIKSGHAWTLQGHYGRTAKDLIDAGYLDEQGNILKDVDNEASSLEEPSDLAMGASKKSVFKKIAAYNKGDSREDTIKKDYELRVKGMSDYNLAELLAEYITNEDNVATLNLNEEKEKQLKAVKGGRDASEKKLLSFIGEHTQVDWKKAFKKFEESEVKQASEKDLYKEWKEEKHAWDKDTKFEATSEKEKLEQMEGVGKEEEKGQVGKEASLKTEAATPSEIVEKKVEKLIKEKIDEAFAEVPATSVLPDQPEVPVVEEGSPVDKVLDKLQEPHVEPMEEPEVEEKEIEKVKEDEKKEEPVEASLKTALHEMECKNCGYHGSDFSFVNVTTPNDPNHTGLVCPKCKKEQGVETGNKTEAAGEYHEPMKEAAPTDLTYHLLHTTEQHGNHRLQKTWCGKDSMMPYTEIVPERIWEQVPPVQKCKECDKSYTNGAIKTAAPVPNAVPVDVPLSERSYHGWKNYETYVVSLWVEGDDTLKTEVAKLASSGKNSYEIAQEIKTLVQKMEPDLGGTMFADLVSNALNAVNWEEIADQYAGAHEEVKKEEPIAPEPEAAMEIAPQASKKEVLAKVAEIASPWRVVKNEKGEDVIARITPTKSEIKSKEIDKSKITSHETK